jgi:5-methylthioadenosine/S-adenosylhomocysteine deaminase
MFTEMRTAALLQKVRHGSRALPALTALRMATTGGARALGLADQIGSIEVGKCADLQLLNLNKLHTTPQPDPISTIVYAAEAGDVETVIIDGRIVMRDGELLTLNEQDVIAEASDQSQRFAGQE